MEQTASKPQTIILIGPDRVILSDPYVIIEARHEMPDWEVRDFNPAPIYFQDKKYQLVVKRRARRPYAVRYYLQPWPEGQQAAANQFHTYDAEAVAERDAARRGGQRDELVRAMLMPLYPILGLLWSGMQKRLTRFGFIPRSITGVSIFTAFCVLFAEGIFTLITINASMRSRTPMIGGMIRAFSGSDHLQLGPVAIPLNLLDILLAVSCLADVVVRYNHYLREDEWAGGFLEWLVPKSLRRK